MNYGRFFKVKSEGVAILILTSCSLLFLLSSILVIINTIPQSYGWLGISEHIKDRIAVGDALVRTPTLPITRYMYTAQAFTVTNPTCIPILCDERFGPGDAVSIIRLTFEGGGGPVYIATRKTSQTR